MKKLSILLLLVLLNCQAIIYGAASDFQKINLGMTKEQVIQAIGKPVSISADADKNEERLVYKRMKHTISAWPRTYEVILRNKKVIKYGEQYEEKNINHF